jgi:N-acyl-D-aspartate/D-glutamate deacylase
MDHDLLVRGGTVIDGTGAAPRTADVAVRNGLITAVGDAARGGRVDGRASRVIDAGGLVVTPGFVDIHAHYDGQATWDERMTPSSWHGVTTVVVGNCGVGFAPVRPSDRGRLVELMEGVEDIPGAVLDEGLSWEWESFGSFMDAVGRRSFDMDVALQVPHGALRLNVIGERGAARESATEDDIAQMAAMARAAVEAGALGFTTSRTLNHRTSRGEPTPTLTAGADELVGIARAIGTTGQGVLQVVSDFADIEVEFGIFRRMAAESGRPLSFSLVQLPDGRWRRLLDLLSEANAGGVAMSAQVAARAIGLLVGLQCTVHPFVGNAAFQEIAGLPLGDQVAALSDPRFKERVIAAAHARLADGSRGAGRLQRLLDGTYELTDPPDYEPDPATSIGRRATAAGHDAVETIYDLMLDDGGEAMFYVPLISYDDGNLDAIGEMLAHPHTVPGLGDGGAHVGTICDASFPTTLLTWWGRDRANGRLDLPYLVQQQTRDTARTVGLFDRGVIAPGYRADLNLIDFEHLAARRPEISYDLPAGGRRLVQRADGYVATIAAGQVTYEQGEPTGALPGRLIRGPQAAPAPASTPQGGIR